MFCHSCGAKNDDGAQICHRCGTQLVAPSQAAAVQQQPNPQPAAQPNPQAYQMPPQGGQPVPGAYGQPQYPGQPMAMGQRIGNNMGLAITAMVVGFLCNIVGLIFGVVALFQANKVDNLQNIGDMEGAQRAADAAKTWSWVSLITTIVLSIFLGIFLLILALADGANF